MNISELYQKFTKGESLSTLGVRESRALLDYCRSKLLGMGRTLKAAATGTTAEAKQALLAAHRELQSAGLADGGQVYNSAVPQETRTIEEVEQCLAMLRAHNATPRKREFRPTPATEADLRRQFEIAKQNRPTPAKSSTPAKPSPTPARPTAPSAPPPFRRKPEEKDTFKSASDSTLLKTASGKAGAQHVAGAVAELTRRGWERLPRGGWTRRKA